MQRGLPGFTRSRGVSARAVGKRELEVCGIIGYVGQRPCKQLLLQGLERLEYRGYDSAGIVLLEEDALEYVRAVGNLQYLREAVGSTVSEAATGLGHTRW